MWSAECKNEKFPDEKDIPKKTSVPKQSSQNVIVSEACKGPKTSKVDDYKLKRLEKNVILKNLKKYYFNVAFHNPKTQFGN